MTVGIALICCTALGILLGATGARTGRRLQPADPGGDQLALVSELRRQVRELADLYTHPAGLARDDHPRAAVVVAERERPGVLTSAA